MKNATVQSNLCLIVLCDVDRSPRKYCDVTAGIKLAVAQDTRVVSTLHPRKSIYLT